MMTKERELLARAGLIIAQYRFKDPDDQNLHKLAQELNKYFEDNPQRKPMTEGEIQKHSIFWLLYDQKSFVAGIRFAEKHHKIGGDDDN